MIRYFFSLLLLLNLSFAKEFNINFNNITTHNLIKITAKLLDKNIFFDSIIEGQVNFISNGKINKSNLLEVLKYDLLSKGYTLQQVDKYYIIKKIEKKVDIVSIKNLNVEAIKKQIDDLLENEYLKTLKNNSSISTNKDTNSLILVGSDKSIKLLKEFIQKLDTPIEQVYVEAKILEISKSKVDNFGVQYGFNGFNATGSTLTTLSSVLNGSGSVSPLSLEELSLYGYSPAVLQHGLSLGIAINLLNQNKALDVISEPSLLCINNKQSSIYVGETQAIATGTTVGTTTTTNYEREDIGLKLSVTPRIAQDNKVTLEINTLLEDIKKTQSAIGGIPNTDKKEILTTAVVKNGESVILGGLIKNKLENVEDNLPFFSDIPLLGKLFQNTYMINDKVNLVIIITPYIVPKQKDITFIKEQLSRLELLTQKITQDVDTTLKEQKNKQVDNDSYKQHDEKIKQLFNL